MEIIYNQVNSEKPSRDIYKLSVKIVCKLYKCRLRALWEYCKGIILNYHTLGKPIEVRRNKCGDRVV